MFEANVQMSKYSLDGRYDVLLTRGTPTTRAKPDARSRAGVYVAGKKGNKVALKIITFIAGIQAGFSLGSGLKAVGVTSGLARAGITAGVSYVSYRVGQKLTGGVGRFTAGISLGAALFSAYEGWTWLQKLDKQLRWIYSYPDGFVQPDTSHVIWNYGSIMYTP